MNWDWRRTMVVVSLIGVLTATGRGQEVTVDVSVVDAAGLPVDGLVVSLFGESFDWDEDVTNQQGSVQLSVARPDSETTLVVGLLAPSFDRQGDEKWREWEARRQEVLHDHAADGLYLVALEEGVSSYLLTVTLYEAVTITGRVLVENEPTPTSVSLLGSLRGYMSDHATGVFVVGGVRSGAPAAVLLVKGYGQREIHWLDGAQTQDDVELGDIHLSPLPMNSRLDLDLVDWDDLDLRGRLRVPTVALVRDDGLLVLSLKIDQGGRARVMRSSTEDLSVPEGTYYVATGPEGPDPVANRLIQLIHEGVVDLDAAGVAKITTVAGQVTSVTLSAPAIENAVLNAGK